MGLHHTGCLLPHYARSLAAKLQASALSCKEALTSMCANCCSSRILRHCPEVSENKNRKRRLALKTVFEAMHVLSAQAADLAGPLSRLSGLVQSDDECVHKLTV